MKNVLLAAVVVVALVGGGLGGTFAHFSDTEISPDNAIRVGSMDLKIYTKTPVGGPFDDPNVPRLVVALDMQPCKSAGFTWKVANTGQPEDDPCDLYIHFKNVECEDVPDKLGNPKPEPEVVAENGGWVDQVEVPGIGDIPCFATQHTSVTIYYPWDQDTQTGPVAFTGKMDEIVSKNIKLGDLPKCHEEDIHLVLHVQDIDEDDLIAAGVIPDPGTGYGYFDESDPMILEKCWDKWPTNALMKDLITFDIEFSLVQIDP